MPTILVTVDEPRRAATVEGDDALDVSVGTGSPLGVAVFATAAARATRAPSRIGQAGYQTNEATFWVGYGTGAGQWKLTGAGELFQRVADATGRGNATPAFVGQYLFQVDTEAWYTGDTVAVGDWTLAEVFVAGATYAVDDIIAANRLLWKCTAALATAPAWAEPGTGTGWQKYWEPWLVEGYHYRRKTDLRGGVLGRWVELAGGDTLPDWQYAINWLITNPDVLEYNGGGSPSNTDYKWLDGTPLTRANVASAARAWGSGVNYTTAVAATNFAHRSNAWYKCHTAHLSATANAPGTGVDWEDYWILWTEDPRNIGTIEFSGGDYPFHGVIRWPRGVSFVSSGRDQQQRSARCVLESGLATATYFVEGIKSSANASANASFWTSWTGPGIVVNGRCKAVYFAGSDGSHFQAEVTEYSYKTPLTIAEGSDNCEIEIKATETNLPGSRAPQIVYCEHDVKAITFSNPILGCAGVGISFGELYGCTIINPEAESCGQLFEVRREADDDQYPGTWGALGSDYVIGDRVMHGGSRWVCYNHIRTSVANQEPGVGVEAYKYWENCDDQSAGKCGGLTIMGGRSLRHSTAPGDTDECIAFIRYQTGVNAGFDSCRIINHILDIDGDQIDVAHTWQHITMQEIGSGDDNTFDVPVFTLVGADGLVAAGRTEMCMDHTEDKVVVNFDLQTLLRHGKHTRRASTPAHGASTAAKTVDGRWVSNDNPATITGNTNENVTLAEGFYEVEIVGTWTGAATITIDDEEGNPLPYFAAVTADKIRRLYHGGGVVNVAMTGSTPTPSVNVYFKPLPIG